MKTYWLHVKTKNLLTISAIKGILNEICFKNKNPAFPAKHHEKGYLFPAFPAQFFKNTLFAAFPAFPAIVATN